VGRAPCHHQLFGPALQGPHVPLHAAARCRATGDGCGRCLPPPRPRGLWLRSMSSNGRRLRESVEGKRRTQELALPHRRAACFGFIDSARKPKCPARGGPTRRSNLSTASSTFLTLSSWKPSRSSRATVASGLASMPSSRLTCRTAGRTAGAKSFLDAATLTGSRFFFSRRCHSRHRGLRSGRPLGRDPVRQ